MCFPRQLHLQSIQVIFFIFLNKWFSVFWIQKYDELEVKLDELEVWWIHQGHFYFYFLFCVWTCKGGITKSNRMWCEMTASNVACHGSVRQTSLTSLQMENSLCCIVFHTRGQVCSSLFLCRCEHNQPGDWLMGSWLFTGLILAVYFGSRRWPSAFAAEVFLFNFDLLRVRLSFFSRSAE